MTLFASLCHSQRSHLANIHNTTRDIQNYSNLRENFVSAETDPTVPLRGDFEQTNQAAKIEEIQPFPGFTDHIRTFKDELLFLLSDRQHVESVPRGQQRGNVEQTGHRLRNAQGRSTHSKVRLSLLDINCGSYLLSM